MRRVRAHCVVCHSAYRKRLHCIISGQHSTAGKARTLGRGADIITPHAATAIMGKDSMRLETIAVHAGRSSDTATGAVAQPIQLSTTFERNPDGSFPQGHIYARSSNPNRQVLETCLAALEGGEVAAAFASGSAASLAVFQSLAP